MEMYGIYINKVHIINARERVWGEECGMHLIKHNDVIIEALTWREQEIMELLGERLTNQEIAAKLSLSLNSVKWYTQQIFRKLGVNNRRQAIALGAEIQKRTGSGAVSLSASQASSDQSDLAALRPKHNLPVHLNAFIEREKELAEVRELLENHRLVTLTGSGGVGKTRLAEQAAQEALDTFQPGFGS